MDTLWRFRLLNEDGKLLEEPIDPRASTERVGLSGGASSHRANVNVNVNTTTQKSEASSSVYA